MSKTPIDQVLEHFRLPFELHPLQAEEINKLAPLKRAGLYWEVGVGKTVGATSIALYKKLLASDTVVMVLMPPVLITQWKRWLEKVEGIRNVFAYRGTPKERAKMDLKAADWLLMSIQIFKKDYIRLCHEFPTDSDSRPVVVIVDEATSIKNPASGNHRAVRDFVDARDAVFMPLTGTPLSTPKDAYGYIAIVSPGIYTSQRHFERLHVKERDLFDNIVEYDNIDLLADNLMVNSSRLLKKEVHPDMDEPIYVPIRYELDPAHMRLYRKLAEEQYLEMKSGGVMRADSAPKLYNLVQQLIMNWPVFSENLENVPAGVRLVEMALEEIDAAYRDDKDRLLPRNHEDRKLLVCANYRMTNRYLIEYFKDFGAVGFYGEISQTRQEKNYDRFLHDSSCRVGFIQPLSGGYGLDDFKLACADMLFVETPVIPMHFNQAVGRLSRTGQRYAPTIRLGIAEGTLQVRLHSQLLRNDALVNRVAGGWEDLRDAIYGKE